MVTRVLLIGVMLLSVTALSAQSTASFKQYNAERQARFDKYREQKRKAFEEFRRKRNEEFAKLLRKDWTPVESRPAEPRPKDESRPPVVAPEEDKRPTTPVKPKPTPIEEVVPAPQPQPQPQPVDPIDEVPATPKAPTTPVQQFTFLGTTEKVRLDKKNLVHLSKLNKHAVANAWLKLSEEAYTNLIHDCLQIREERNLCDWAYLLMLEQMAESLCGKGSNDATLLMAYVYCQSGYKMRLAMDSKQLYMLFASHHKIYDWDRFSIDGADYYPYKYEQVGNIVLSDQKFPGEQPLSLLVEKEPVLATTATTATAHQSTRYKQFAFSVEANQNLLDFYTSYPTSMIGSNTVSRWAMYANMPMPENTRKQLYPHIRRATEGLGMADATERILNWVQTGFKYKLDDVVWGEDRAFFPEESLHYPYCDCEDRSILFTRIVRDLLGLDCILVYYPGHLATAVHIPGEVRGDYIELNGVRYTIADPTYINARVGMTMPGMNNAAAKVILLK